MTRDEIVGMLAEIDFQFFGKQDWDIFDKYEAFAKLVAEKEREACAKVCETLELPDWPDKVRQPLSQAIRSRGQS
jgi:hypothetical protein